MSKPPRPVIERLESKTDKSGNCWIWTGAKTAEGYGKLSMPPKKYAFAHRVWFQITRGEIPAGMQLDHLCRNPSCVNPDHLEVVSNAENTKRGKVSALRPPRTHCGQNHDLSLTGYSNAQGKVLCKTCQLIVQRAYRERKRNAAK